MAALLLLALCAILPAHAAELLVLDGHSNSFPLRGHLSRLDDPSATLTIAEAAASPDFRPRSAGTVERNYTRAAVWYRFTVLRPTGLPADWLLTIGEPFIEDIRVYTDIGGRIEETQLGRRIPNADLPLAARSHVTKLVLPENQPVTIHVRLTSPDEIQFEAALWHEDALLFAEVRAATLLGMFFATILFIVTVYVLFGLWLRDPPMLSYAAYLSTFVLFSGSHSGLAAILFPASGAMASYVMIGVGVLGNVATMIFMWDQVLRLKTTFPAMHKVYMVGCALAAASLLSLLTPWFIHLVRPTFIATLVVTLVSLVLALRLILKGGGDYLLKYYVAAFVPFLGFTLAHAAEVFFPEALDVMLVRVLGAVTMLAHILILSAALAHRIGRVQSDRVRADAELSAARSAMREHSNFVSMLSHQLRTPLAIILAAVDLFDLKHPGSEHAAKIRRAVLRMRDLTADVLAEARLTEASGTLDRRRVELVPLLQRLAEEQSDGAGDRIHLQSCDNPCTVLGDPTLLAVMFANLMDNAVKYSGPDGETRVGFAFKGNAVAITIADNGPGIAHQERHRIFEKFYRSELAAQPGTGLGLYLVRQIAQRHGGTVTVESQPGEGSAFTVVLPLV